MTKITLFLFLLIQSPLILAATEDGRWHAGIGDATVFGWITVAVYLLAVARCIVKANASKKFGGNYLFWLYLAIFLLFLGVNKQLDLQSWFTEMLKDAAQHHGWYEHRRPVQVAFIVVLGFGMLMALIAFRLFLVNTWRNYKLAWMGIILLCTFILIRAASFHHVDILINTEILGLRLNVLLEIGAILIIILGTYFNKKQVNSLLADTISVRDYVQIEKEGDIVRCPQCGTQPLSKTRDDRLFKCRSCGFKYTVRVMNI
ncbi:MULTISPECIES: hypothetical protein [Methylotenera]|uniref:hypothetical protein n=1 Tax=Methylotenera TaxID=359407 RepID=UPI0003683E18|nr:MULTISPECIES: hypothetical protein [Methylotenera]